MEVFLDAAGLARLSATLRQRLTTASGSSPLATEPAEPGANAPSHPDKLRRRDIRQRIRLEPAAAFPFLVLLVYLLLSLWMFRAWNLSPTSHTVGHGGGEAAFFLWMLRWTPFAITHGHNPFLTGYLNAPDGVNLLWNTSLMLPGLLLAPVTLTLGPVASYNLLLTLGLSLSAWTAYLVMRRYVTSELAAALGGLVYGFSPYMRAHSLGHANLTLAFLPPLLLALLDNILVRQRRGPVRDGVLLGGLAACQFLIGEELLATTALVGALLLVMLVITHRREVRAHAPYALRAFGVAAAVCLVLVAAPLTVQFFGPYRYNGPASKATGRLVTDLYGFVVPSPHQLLSTEASAEVTARLPGNSAERNAYLGVPLLALVAGVALRWWFRPVVRVGTLLGLATAIGSMGPRLYLHGDRTDLWLPWAAVHRLPLLESIIPSRLALYTALFAGLLLAYFVEQARRWQGSGRVLAVAIVVVALAPLVPRPVAGIGPVQVPPFFTGPGIKRIPTDSVALVVPFPGDRRTRPMLWQATAGIHFKMPGGYFLGPDRAGRARFGPPPSATQQTLVDLTSGHGRAEPDQQRCQAIKRDLVNWDVRSILIGPTKGRQEVVGFFTQLLGRPPQTIDGAQLWENVKPDTLCR
jgi:hypothetical protein